MMRVNNPFESIYRTCNSGNNAEKYELIGGGVSQNIWI